MKNSDKLPEVSKTFTHTFKYDRYEILKSLYMELGEKYASAPKKEKKFIDVSFPRFSQIIAKFENLFGITKQEARAVFYSIETGRVIDGNPFFVFNIKDFDVEEMKLSINVGREELLQIDYEPSCEEEQFYLNRHYKPSCYCRIYNDSIDFNLVATDLGW